MAKLSSDYDIDCKRHFRVEAGQNSPYGTVSHRILTNHGSKTAFYKKGNLENYHLATTGSSFEFLGQSIERPREAAQEAFIPAKLIKCKNGDVMIDVDQGDIILQADNIILKAKGTRDSNDGDVRIDANKAIRVDAPDVRVTSDNMNLMAMDKFSLSGKVYGGIIAGTLHLASRSDFGASIELDKVMELKKALEAKR